MCNRPFLVHLLKEKLNENAFLFISELKQISLFSFYVQINTWKHTHCRVVLVKMSTIVKKEEMLPYTPLNTELESEATVSI